MYVEADRLVEYNTLGRTSAFVIAACFALLCTAGSLRFVLGFDQLIYYGSVGLLCALLVLRANRVFFEKRVFVYLLLVFTLLSWLAVSSLWSVSPEQAKQDFVLLIALAIIVLLGTFLGHRSWIKKFFPVFSFIGLVAGAFVLLTSGFLPLTVQIGEGIENAYLTLSATIAAAFIISTIHAIHASKYRWAWSLASLLLMVSLSQSLARGALLSSIMIIILIGIVYTVFKARRGVSNRHVTIRYLVLVVPMLLALIHLALNVERTNARLERMIDVEQELAEGGRGGLWVNSWEHISASPIKGHGLGSSGILIADQEGYYPHNLLLQLWLDGGLLAVLLGLAIVLIPLGAGARLLIRQPGDPIALSLVGIMTFYTLEYMKSFSFYTGRPLLIGAILLVVYAGSAWASKNSTKVSERSQP